MLTHALVYIHTFYSRRISVFQSSPQHLLEVLQPWTNISYYLSVRLPFCSYFFTLEHYMLVETYIPFYYDVGLLIIVQPSGRYSLILVSFHLSKYGVPSSADMSQTNHQHCVLLLLDMNFHSFQLL